MPLMIWILLTLLVVAGVAALLWSVYTTRFNQRREVVFTGLEGPLVNPLIGWMPWATDKVFQQPFTLVYAPITWRQLEPVEGMLDFSTFETANQVALWRQRDVKLVVRFLMDVPGPEAHLDIPDWLYERIGGAGDAYDSVFGKGFSPDYSHPLLIAAHQKVLQAFSDQYQDQGLIAYVQLGSLGHWGEWHVQTSAGVRPMPGEAIRDTYVQQYYTAFPRTHLQMRRPFNIAADLNLGLFNDMSGDPEATIEWLDWIANGGMYNQTGETFALSPMPDAWKISPIGGEQSGSLSNQELFTDQLHQTVSLLQESHASFVGPRRTAELTLDGPLQPGMDRVVETLGYRFELKKADLPVAVFQDSAAGGSVWIENTGIAPLYYNWPFEFYLLDASSEVLSTVQVDGKINTLLPSQTRRIGFELPIRELGDGTYTIAFSLIDPADEKPAIRFANPSEREDLIYLLGDFIIERDLKEYLALR